MTENTAIVLNLAAPNISSVVYAVQNDRLSRHIVAQLLDGSTAWTPPAGASAVIRYLKPDGTGGYYDTDENDDPAISISGSTATLTIAEQALTVPGDVYFQLNFYTAAGEKVTTFAWLLRVQKSVISDAEIVSSDYYNTLTATIAQGIEVAQQLTYPVPVNNGGTGAGTQTAALLNLSAFDLKAGTSIPSSSNMDDYKTPGVYYSASSSVSSSLINPPFSDAAFKLEVMDIIAVTGSVRVLQVAQANNSTQEKRRYWNGSAWSAWVTMVVDSVFPLAVSMGGTNATSVGGALANLGLNDLHAKNTEVSGGASGSISVGNAAKGIIICSGVQSGFKGLYIFNTTTTGGVTTATVLAAADITVGGSSGSLTFANGAASGGCTITVIYTQLYS